MIRHAIVALAVLALAPTARADSSLTLEGFAGWQNLQASTNSVTNALQGNEGTAILGADLLARLDGLGLGVSLDKTLGGSVHPWAGSVMAGLLIDLLPSLRLDALGEIGRRGVDFGDMFNSSGVTFVGLRPGLSIRLLPTGVRIGASALVRWPTSGSEIGSPDFGLVGRVGLELP